MDNVVYIGNLSVKSLKLAIMPCMNETESISHSTNTLGKGMNPIILPPAMGK